MTSFEYIGVLISVLLGLAITHLVVGSVSAIQNRKTTHFYWVHTLWVFNTLVYITQFWWYINTWRGLESWSLSIFYLIFGYAVLMSACAGLLFPIHGNVKDFRAYYYEHSRWLFSIWFLTLLVDVLEVLVKASVGIRAIPDAYFPWTMTLLLLLFIAIFVKNARYHGFLAVTMFFLQTVWPFLYISTVTSL